MREREKPDPIGKKRVECPKGSPSFEFYGCFVLRGERREETLKRGHQRRRTCTTNPLKRGRGGGNGLYVPEKKVRQKRGKKLRRLTGYGASCREYNFIREGGGRKVRRGKRAAGK